MLLNRIELMTLPKFACCANPKPQTDSPAPEESLWATESVILKKSSGKKYQHIDPEELFGFLIRFSSLIVDNAGIQFSIMLAVAAVDQIFETLAKQLESKCNVFVVFFKAFLNKYFLPQAHAIDEELRQLESQQADGKTQPKTSKARSAEKRVDALAKEVSYFFSFLGTLAVEYYCLNSLSFQAMNDMGIKVKIDHCAYLNDSILADFFMSHFFHKYLSPTFTELYQRRYVQELTVFSHRLASLQHVSARDLSIPFEVFPDYAGFYSLLQASQKDKSSRIYSEVAKQKETADKTTDDELQENIKVSSFMDSKSAKLGRFCEAREARDPADLSLISKTSGLSAGEAQSDYQRSPKTSVASEFGLLRFQNSSKTSRQDRSLSKGRSQEPKLFSTVLSDSDLLRSEESERRKSRHGSSQKRSGRQFLFRDGQSVVGRMPEEDKKRLLELFRSRSDRVPFVESIGELRKVRFIETPLDKLRCIYRALSIAICEVREFCSSVASKEKSSVLLTIDHLQSVFIYLVIKGGVSSLISHLKIVQAFFISTGIVDTDKLCYLLEAVIRFVAEVH